MIRRQVIILILAVITITAQAQFLVNPSFEGEGNDNEPPLNWYSCSPLGSPDNPPLPAEILVDLPASEGSRYLSLRARGDIPDPAWVDHRGARDDVSNRLLQPLEQGKNYSLSIDLATDYEVVLFWVVSDMEPIQIRLWAGNTQCAKEELLASSGPVTNTDWETFEICFSPQEDSYSWFLLEADYIDNDTTNGIILADNLVIQEIDDDNLINEYTLEVLPDTPIQLEATESDSYIWTPEEGLSCTDCKSPIANITEDVTYLVELINPTECSMFEKYNLLLANCEAINKRYSGMIIDTAIDYGSSLELNVPYGETFIWTPSESLSCSECSTPIATPLEPTNYIATSTDKYDCQVQFEYRLDINLKIPNAITPNNDGFNDNFVVEALPDNSKLKILDRLGNLVFETDNYENNWPSVEFNSISKQTDTFWYLLECDGFSPFQGYILVKF